MNSVLDTNAVLYFLAGRLRQPLPQANYYLSVITEIELLSYPLLKKEEETAIREFCNDVTIMGITDPIKNSAIALRRQHKLKLPDTLIVATALCLNAELLTNDIKLLNINGLMARPLPLI